MDVIAKDSEPTLNPEPWRNPPEYQGRVHWDPAEPCCRDRQLPYWSLLKFCSFIVSSSLARLCSDTRTDTGTPFTLAVPLLYFIPAPSHLSRALVYAFGAPVQLTSPRLSATSRFPATTRRPTSESFPVSVPVPVARRVSNRRLWIPVVPFETSDIPPTSHRTTEPNPQLISPERDTPSLCE